jgi:glucokinase
MNNLAVIGIDLGGSAVKIGRFLEDGTCLESTLVPTPQPATPKAVINAIVPKILEFQADGNCVAIGVGTPGPADLQGRIALEAFNLPGWHNVPIADYLETETGLPTVVANDANCAALGESWLGAGRKFRNFFLLTLGTGVGGGIILDGKLFVGHRGAAGELGVITLNPNGPPCNSGNQGSLEQYLSIKAIFRATGKEPATLGALAENGDVKALTFWQNYGQLLGAGLASLIYVLSPEAAIIGGGISASAKFFLPTAKLEVERRVTPTSRVGLELLIAELGNRAGMVGAAKLGWLKFSS